jgi:DNA-binding MarR family transcriptional regulator
MSRDKRTIFDKLVYEIRRSQEATARYDDAVGAAVGLGRTDMRCLDVLQREGPASAGRLAEATGLTSGAMTAAIDRLERAGLARRVPDASDRRRVLVQLGPAAQGAMARFYGAHVEESERIYRRYSTEQLELLLGFVRGSREFNERHAAALEAETRSASPAAPARPRRG